MADYVDNLILQVQGRADVERLTAAVQAEEKAVLAAVTAHGQQSTQARAAATALQGYQQQLQQTQRVVQTTSTSTKNYGQAALTASYAFQDFTSVQGSLAQKLSSVQNNLPGLIASFGGSAGLAGAVSIAAVASGLFISNWDAIVKSLQSTTPFAKIAGDLEGMKQQLSANEGEMRKLAAAGELTATQATHYLDLRGKALELEKKITEESEKQARLKGLMNLKDPEKTAAEKERADALSPQFGDPDNKALVNAVNKAMPRDTKKPLQDAYREALKKEQEGLALGAMLPQPVMDALKKRAEDLRVKLQAEEDRIAKEAQQLVADAVVGGKEGAFNRILGMMGDKPGLFNEKQRDAFNAASPQGKLERKELAKRMGLDENGNPLPKPGEGGEGGAAGGGGGGGGAGAGGAVRPKPIRVTTPDGRVLTGDEIAQWERDQRAGRNKPDLPAGPPPPGMGKGGKKGRTVAQKIKEGIAATRARNTARQAKAHAAAARRPQFGRPDFVKGPNGVPIDMRHPAAPGRNRRRNPWDPIGRETPIGFGNDHPAAPGPPRAKGAAQAQDGVQALAQVNGQIVQGSQQTNEALIRLAADTQRALARTQSQLAALARQKQQDGDSFLPVTW